MTANPLYRIGIDVFICVAALIAPWWLPLIAATVALFFFDRYIEIIIVGLLIDFLYNAPLHRFHHFQFVATALAIIIFIVGGYIKNRIRL